MDQAYTIWDALMFLLFLGQTCLEHLLQAGFVQGYKDEQTWLCTEQLKCSMVGPYQPGSNSVVEAQRRRPLTPLGRAGNFPAERGTAQRGPGGRSSTAESMERNREGGCGVLRSTQPSTAGGDLRLWARPTQLPAGVWWVSREQVLHF